MNEYTVNDVITIILLTAIVPKDYLNKNHKEAFQHIMNGDFIIKHKESEV